MAQEYAEVECEVELVTENAVRIWDGSVRTWIPRSQIEDPDPEDMEVGEYITLLIPEWLAVEKGLV